MTARDREDVSPLALFRRMTANLALAYDTAGPGKIAMFLSQAGREIVELLAGGSLPESKARDAKAVYAQLLALSARAACELGRFEESARSAQLAADVAGEVGDDQTAGHAWALVACAQRDTGRYRGALNTARRAHAVAGNRPAGVAALLDEATIAAKMGDAQAAFDAVIAAEKAHASLPEAAWGAPGAPLGTIHPSRLRAFAGWSLAAVGMYGEAAPRLEEAADLLAATSGSAKADVWLTQALVAVGTGDVDAAYHLASIALAHERTRPSAWVARRVEDLCTRSDGALAGLAEQVRGWGFRSNSGFRSN
jgi:tetratricopeptide (TPR) repeat protein